MKKGCKLLACIMASALVLSSVPGMPSTADGNAVYVSDGGSETNSGIDRENPLNSIYAAQDLLPDGGTIIVSSTIYISGERSYSLNEGIVLKADEGLEGPVFEVADGGELTLNNIVIIGNSSMLISNNGMLKMDDSVALKVMGSDSVGYVYTGENGATYLNGELVAGQESGQETQQSETAESETEAVSETETAWEDESEAAQTEPKQTEVAAESESQETETTHKDNSGNESKPEETSETPQSESVETETQASEAPQTETEKQQETQPTEVPETETIRTEAVETVKNAISSLNIHSRKDVTSLLAVSQAYEGLTEAEKDAIPEKIKQVLKSAQDMAAAYNHTQLGVTVYGNLPWYVQFQVKLVDVEEEEEAGLTILMPYELKLWNLYTDSDYTLPEGETVTVTMPVPDIDIKGEFTIFHYKSDGSVEKITPFIKGNLMSFETSSFSPFSVAGSTVIVGVGVGSGSNSNDSSKVNGTTDSGGQSNSQSQGNSGNSSNGSSSTGSSSTGGSSTGSSSSGSNSSGTGTSSNKTTAAVNTGDNTKVWLYVTAGLGGVLVMAGIMLLRRKEN